MDQYLEPNVAFKRLYDELMKYGSLYGAFDFDGTVYDFHKKGAKHEMVKQLIRDLYSIGCKLDCWTAQNDHELVKDFLDKENIPFEGINTDGIPLPWKCRKPLYSFLLDDRAGLDSVYRDLELLVYIIKKERHALQTTDANSTASL